MDNFVEDVKNDKWLISFSSNYFEVILAVCEWALSSRNLKLNSIIDISGINFTSHGFLTKTYKHKAMKEKCIPDITDPLMHPWTYLLVIFAFASLLTWATVHCFLLWTPNRMSSEKNMFHSSRKFTLSSVLFLLSIGDIFIQTIYNSFQGITNSISTLLNKVYILVGSILSSICFFGPSLFERTPTASV